jgi:hypothetical protein
MSEESELKRQGEELAKAAVDSKLGAKQLRTIYTLTKTKPLPMVEAFLQHQLGRVLGVKALEMALGLLAKHRENKAAFSRILMYANMLYNFYEREATMKYRSVIEDVAKGICEQQGCRYVGLELSTERDRVVARVSVSGFRGDPRILASSIDTEILHRELNFAGRIWIEQADRR